jgi:hypothetical protein
MKSSLCLCLSALVTLSVVGCGESHTDERATLTRREKDSILGASKIPGARGVKRAMTSADSASARQARLDSAEREP